jgi:hypothetical protein
MRKTKPVLVSADAPATPKRSVAITAAKAAATARASVLDDRANDAGRFPASLIVAPFNAVVLPPSIRPSQLQTAASTHGSRPPHWVAHGFHDALMTGTSQEEIREWAVRPSAKLACASAHPAGTAAARAPGACPLVCLIDGYDAVASRFHSCSLQTLQHATITAVWALGAASECLPESPAGASEPRRPSGVRRRQATILPRTRT